jgi:small GTP-binding protein
MIKDYLKNNKIILVITKKDMLPLSVTDQKIVAYIKNECGVFDDIVVISAYKNYNIDRLMSLIKKHRVYKDVYVVGNTNAGKSTLINKIIDDYSIDTSLITISNMPSTTLDQIRIPFKDYYLIDTPGLVDFHNIVNYISDSNIKKLSCHKEIKPRTYQIKKGQALIIEDFLRIDYVEGEKNSFTVFVSNNVDIKRINGKRHDYLKDLSRKEINLK